MTAKKTAKAVKGPRWSLGLFHNRHGRLATVYVNADAEPMPYEAGRVGDAEIVFSGVYSGMPYRDARQQLLKDAKKAGIVDQPVKVEAKPVKAAKKAPAKKAPAKKAKKAAKK
jgi:hypothetical protein